MSKPPTQGIEDGRSQMINGESACLAEMFSSASGYQVLSKEQQACGQ